MNLSKEQRAQLEKKSGIRVPEKDIILKGGINQVMPTQTALERQRLLIRWRSGWSCFIIWLRIGEL